MKAVQMSMSTQCRHYMRHDATFTYRHAIPTFAKACRMQQMQPKPPILNINRICLSKLSCSCSNNTQATICLPRPLAVVMR
jgi:hypothetical protein